MRSGGGVDEVVESKQQYQFDGSFCCRNLCIMAWSMSQTMKILAYLVFGMRSEYEIELIFSALSAMRWMSGASGITICVVTDRPSSVSRLPVDTLHVSSEDIARWTLNGKNIFRAKACALLRVLAHYSAPCVLIDTDTYFIRDPLALFERISPNDSLMHASDGYCIGDSQLWSQILPFIDQLGSSDVPVSRSSEMLNSGAVGLYPQNAALIENAIVLMDRLYAHTPIFNIEQFAIGAALQTKTKVHRCNDVLQHYWGYRRPFIHLEIRRFLDASRSLEQEEWIEQSAFVETDFPRRPLFDRIMTKLRAIYSHWDGDYRFAYLAYRLARVYSEKDSQIASIWASTALASLERSLMAESDSSNRWQAKRIRAKSDFRFFTAPASDSLRWLAKDVKTAWAAHWKDEHILQGDHEDQSDIVSTSS
jgi:hypothetical protein